MLLRTVCHLTSNAVAISGPDNPAKRHQTMSTSRGVKSNRAMLATTVSRHGSGFGCRATGMPALLGCPLHRIRHRTRVPRQAYRETSRLTLGQSSWLTQDVCPGYVILPASRAIADTCMDEDRTLVL